MLRIMLSYRTKIFYYFISGRVWSVVIGVSVCLFVCLSVCSHISKSYAHTRISQNFLYMLPEAVNRSFCNDNATRYVLPVLWSTSCFHITVRIGQNQKQHACFVQLAKWRHGGEVCRLRLHLTFRYFIYLIFHICQLYFIHWVAENRPVLLSQSRPLWPATPHASPWASWPRQIAIRWRWPRGPAVPGVAWSRDLSWHSCTRNSV